MSNYSGKPRLGWVHPKNAPGANAKDAALQAGAGNVTNEPPVLEEVPNPRTTVTQADYPTPRDSGQQATGETGGNFTIAEIPNLQVQPGEDDDIRE